MNAARCPTCGQYLEPRPRKVCVLCGRPMGRRHKWFINEHQQIQHRHCDYPEHYSTPEQRLESTKDSSA